MKEGGRGGEGERGEKEEWTVKMERYDLRDSASSTMSFVTPRLSDC